MSVLCRLKVPVHDDRCVWKRITPASDIEHTGASVARKIKVQLLVIEPVLTPSLCGALPEAHHAMPDGPQYAVPHKSKDTTTQLHGTGFPADRE
jgi:hypothetical protein